MEKIKVNWKKTNGLFKREEWSVTIVRAATTAELAANFIIRKELLEKRKLEEKFVNNLLDWSNGIVVKFQRLILPLSSEEEKKKLNKIKERIAEINRERNSIVHSGQFKKKETALKVIEIAREVIISLVKKYDSKFDLKKIN